MSRNSTGRRRNPNHQRNNATRTPKPAGTVKLTLAKTPTADRPRLSLIKPPRPLPCRTAPGRGAGELAIGHAALAATTLGITARVLGWHAQPDGSVIQRLDHRTTLVHSGQVGDPFTALILCGQGAEHPITVTSPADIQAGHRAAETCEQAHADISHLVRPPAAIVQAFTGIHAAVHTIKTNPAVRTLQDAKGTATTTETRKGTAHVS